MDATFSNISKDVDEAIRILVVRLFVEALVHENVEYQKRLINDFAIDPMGLKTSHIVEVGLEKNGDSIMAWIRGEDIDSCTTRFMSMRKVIAPLGGQVSFVPWEEEKE